MLPPEPMKGIIPPDVATEDETERRPACQAGRGSFACNRQATSLGSKEPSCALWLKHRTGNSARVPNFVSRRFADLE